MPSRRSTRRREPAETAPLTIRLADVAQAAGVSVATASRSLRGIGGVSDAVTARVRVIADELGYVTNHNARTLAGGPTTLVGLIVHQIDDPYFSEIAAGVVREAEAQELTVQIAHSVRDPERELRQIRSLVAQRARSIIITGSGYTDPRREAQARELLTRYTAAGGRAAVIGRHHLGVDAVLPDNEGAAAAVAEHLVALGHRDVLILSGPPTLTTVDDRLRAATRVLAEAGGRAVVVPTDFTGRDAGPSALPVLTAQPELTAVLALSDLMALSVLMTLRNAGIGVPDRVSVCGIDDIAVAQMMSPALTTARFPLAQMGHDALDLTIRPAAARPRRKLIAARLIVRESTAPPARG